MTYNQITSKKETYSFPTIDILHVDIAVRAIAMAAWESIDIPTEAPILHQPFMFTFGSPVGKTPVESIDEAILNYLLDEYPLLPVQRCVTFETKTKKEAFSLPITTVIVETLAMEFIPSNDAGTLANELRGVLDYIGAEEVPVFVSEEKVRMPWPNMLTSITF